MEREIVEQEIEIRTESIIPFPKDNYYTKDEVDDLLDDKANQNAVDGIIIDIDNINDEQVLQNENINSLNDDITLINGDISDIESDMTNLSQISETGSQIALNISTTDYKMTATLKDKNGNVIYTSNEIDLPLESVVVNGRYDSQTKKIILTLQNGTEIEFSVADLVSGLQSEITSTNKLASDLVDDTNNTNKFVTSTEKTTWNSKQDELVSGTNIKSINNNSILGSGNLDLGGDFSCYNITGKSSTEPNIVNDLKPGIYFVGSSGTSGNINLRGSSTNTETMTLSGLALNILFVVRDYTQAENGDILIYFLSSTTYNTGVLIGAITKNTTSNTGLNYASISANNLSNYLYTSPILHTFNKGATFNNKIPTITPTTFTNSNQIVTKGYVDNLVSVNSIGRVTSNSNIWELDNGVYIVDGGIELTYNLRNFRFTTPATKLMMYVGSDEGTSPNIKKMFYLIGRPADSSTGVYPEIIVGLATNDNYGVMNKYNIENFMNTDGIQYISGTKYFNTLPESSIAPTTNNQLVNKSYVDGLVGNINTVLATLTTPGGVSI